MLYYLQQFNFPLKADLLVINVTHKEKTRWVLLQWIFLSFCNLVVVVVVVVVVFVVVVVVVAKGCCRK